MNKYQRLALAATCLVAFISASESALADNSRHNDELAPPPSVKKYLGAEEEGDSRAVEERELASQPSSKRAMSQMRLVALWFAKAYAIPARVPEEMFMAGYTYSDAVVAFSLMDAGASLNEILEQRRHKRWDDVAQSLGIDYMALPQAVRQVMNNPSSGRPYQYLHFMPDVRAGLSDRLRLPSFAPTIPDPVAIQRFKLSADDIANIRQALENPNNLDAELLRRPAGRSLRVGDWVIAGTLAKYKPFPIDTILSVRTGEVVEWGDVASMFSVDPEILVEGPLAPIYAAMIEGENYATISTLRRTSYPETLENTYELSQVQGSELQALGWLMSLYYRESEPERQFLQESGLPLIDQALSLAVARMAFTELAGVVLQVQGGATWKYLLDYYKLDLTGQEVTVAAALARDDQKAPPKKYQKKRARRRGRS